MEITAKDILSFSFYTYKQPFTGSCQGMRYRIIRKEREKPAAYAPQEGEGEEAGKPEVFFEVSTWREPYAYDCTPPEEIEQQEFPFDEEGYRQVLAWLNEKQPGYRK